MSEDSDIGVGILKSDMDLKTALTYSAIFKSLSTFLPKGYSVYLSLLQLREYKPLSFNCFRTSVPLKKFPTRDRRRPGPCYYLLFRCDYFASIDEDVRCPAFLQPSKAKLNLFLTSNLISRRLMIIRYC